VPETSIAGIGWGGAIDPGLCLIADIGVEEENGAALNLAIARAHAFDSIAFGTFHPG
jgi:hypothetical protein